MARRKLTPEQRELKRLCTQLAKVVGPGQKPSPNWIDAEWHRVMSRERALAADAACRDIVTVEQSPFGGLAK